MKRFLDNAATALIVVCAVIVTGLVIRRAIFADPLPKAENSPPETVSDRRSYAVHGRLMGPPSAPVHIVVFSDFQCPACRRFAGELLTIRARSPSQLSITYRYYPLQSHPYAASAARASECAASQGKFETFHNALFAEQSAIGRVPWAHFATAAGVPDTVSFKRCTSEHTPVRAVAIDTVDGNRLGIRVTPTLLVNDIEVRGTPGLSSLEDIIRRGAKVSLH